MGLKKFNIIFDNPDATFYVGQTVTGRVVIVLDSPKKIRGILLKFRGQANVSWTARETETNREGKSETVFTTYYAEEDYFRTQYYCLGGPNSSETELPIGEHIYPFTCVLPPNLPSSFEGEYGYIRYTVKVIIDRPWKFDHERKNAFTVVSQYDLNMYPALAEPVKIPMEKFFCCCWCKSGPLSCLVTLPKRGYVPGEKIEILVDIDNVSNVDVEHVKFELQKVVKYHSRYPRRDTKMETEILQTLSVGPAPGGRSKVFTPTLNLPALPPSNLTNCDIMDLDYKLLIELETDGCHMNETDEISLVIGTIPLRRAPATFGQSPSAPPLDGIPNDAPPQYGDVVGKNIGWVAQPGYPTAPPSYGMYKYGANSLQDKEDNNHTQFGDETFYPRYPVYDLGMPQGKH